MKGSNLKYFVLGAAIVAVGLWGLAVTIPNSFSAGDVLSAAKLNANFAALKTAVDALEAPKTKTISFPGAALATTAAIAAYGPTFATTSVASLTLPRPSDWNRTSSVTVAIYALVRDAGTGNLDFFVRPRRYDPGDGFSDAFGVNGTPVAVTSVDQITKQTFTIPASQWANKELWQLLIQRGGGSETYTGNVAVLSVSFTYTATP